MDPYPRKTGKDGRPHGGDKGADLVQGLDSLLVEVLDGGDASRRDLLRLEVHKGVVVVGSLEGIKEIKKKTKQNKISHTPGFPLIHSHDSSSVSWREASRRGV